MPLAPAGNPIGAPFIELQSVDSTNKYAMDLIHAGMAQHGMAIFAHEQSAGKGQRNRSWSSEPGSNMALSIIINPYPLRISESFRLIACTAVSAVSLLNKLIDDDFCIKWPNDLYWRDRKAGGILIENVISARQTGRDSHFEEQWKWTVTGIGININQVIFPADLPNPVSLKQISGNRFQPLDIARDFCNILQTNFQKMIADGFEEVFSRYNSFLYKSGDQVMLKKNNRLFEATIRGVSQSGQLITQHSMEERFDFGDVEWVIS